VDFVIECVQISVRLYVCTSLWRVSRAVCVCMFVHLCGVGAEQCASVCLYISVACEQSSVRLYVCTSLWRVSRAVCVCMFVHLCGV
jgi:hypothetical protein